MTRKKGKRGGGTGSVHAGGSIDEFALVQGGKKKKKRRIRKIEEEKSDRSR